MHSLTQFVSLLVVVGVLENKQSSRGGIELDLACCANVVLHGRYLAVPMVCVYILFNFFARSERHDNAALGNPVNTLIDRKAI